jgi:hypothetical protein
MRPTDVIPITRKDDPRYPFWGIRPPSVVSIYHTKNSTVSFSKAPLGAGMMKINFRAEPLAFLYRRRWTFDRSVRLKCREHVREGINVKPSQLNSYGRLMSIASFRSESASGPKDTKGYQAMLQAHARLDVMLWRCANLTWPLTLHCYPWQLHESKEVIRLRHYQPKLLNLDE